MYPPYFPLLWTNGEGLPGESSISQSLVRNEAGIGEEVALASRMTFT